MVIFLRLLRFGLCIGFEIGIKLREWKIMIIREKGEKNYYGGLEFLGILGVGRRYIYGRIGKYGLRLFSCLKFQD